jgi:thiosulfate reductase cytochrome b subunit
MLGPISFKSSVVSHNILAAVLVSNAFLGMFYHVVSAKILHYVPKTDSFMEQAILQARYYLYGIFKGEPHPLRKAPSQKLNPLQQVTYLALLNILLPIQVVTGILIWGAERWPEISERVGGLTIITPLHLLCSWLFGSFIVLHVYLTTTGHTPLANIRAMITGKEEIETEDEK